MIAENKMIRHSTNQKELPVAAMIVEHSDDIFKINRDLSREASYQR